MDTRSINSTKRFTPWALVAVVSLLAFYVWGTSFGWHFAHLSAYQFFPLLGLLAFSIMWAFYVIDLFEQYFKDVKLENFFRYCGYVVLVAIVLHPGILIYKRFRDGFGLPPHSYETYVAPSMAWITLLGTASLLVFLAFELHRWFKDKSWWKYVANASDFAMIAIFYHGLELGSQTHVSWFRIIWYLYGVVLLASLIKKYAKLLSQKEPAPTQ